MLKKLNAIFRFFVPTKEQVIARQIKNRHTQSTASPGSAANKATYQSGIDQSRFRGPPGF